MDLLKVDKKAPLFSALGSAISKAIRPNMHLEKIPSKSSAIKTKVYELLSKDFRIEAFDALTEFSSSEVSIKDYIDAVLYAARFLLANKLNNECYLFLAVAQSRVEATYGSPFDYTLYEETGNMFYLTKNYQDAIRVYEKLMEIGERNPAILNFNMGMCYQELNNYPLAIQSFLKSINLDASFTKAAVALGQCYNSLGQYDKAIGTFKQLPDCLEAYVLMGNAYFFMKNYEDAIVQYMKAISINPSAGMYNNLGASLKKAGLLQDAIFAFHDSLALESSGDTVANLITLYIEVGKPDEAEKLYQSSKKFLSNQDSKFFGKLIGEKVERMRRATMIMNKAVMAFSKSPSVNPPSEGPSVNEAVGKAANIFMKKMRK
ncbi:hypothetical protein SteCoe_15123 [Stentor coeruleus]|uniref:UDP-N-acetylglucosamine--peptide N-acetylglucosaminyltransferase SPINDLY n=1 Tax=Stentor coeruleus TaxID=5963 RepID=A0A1R2C4D8_9CILI|nr:hypothetical protein SteCoe_15123 [Stentor coeruleus]